MTNLRMTRLALLIFTPFLFLTLGGCQKKLAMPLNINNVEGKYYNYFWDESYDIRKEGEKYIFRGRGKIDFKYIPISPYVLQDENKILGTLTFGRVEFPDKRHKIVVRVEHVDEQYVMFK